MAAPALVALAHGSRDPRSAATDHRPRRRGQGACAPTCASSRRSSSSSKPSFQTVVDRLVGPATTRSSSYPLLLTEAFHAKVDVPDADRRGDGAPPGPADPRHRVLGLEAASSRCSTCGCARRSRTPGSASSTRWCSPPPAPPTRSPTRPSPGWPGSGAPTTSCPSPRRSPSAAPPATGEAVRAFRAEGRRHIAVASLFLAPGLPARPGRRAGRSRPARSRSPSRWAPTPRSPARSWPATPSAPSSSSRSDPPRSHRTVAAQPTQAARAGARAGGPGRSVSAAVDRAGLEHRAAGRLEEAEALAERLAGRRSPALVARADARRRTPAPRRPGRRRAAGRGRAAGRRSTCQATLEEVGGLAVEHHADVEELLAVDAGHAAQHDVLVGAVGSLMRHLRRQPLAGARAGRSGTRRTPRAAASGVSAPGTGSSQASGTCGDHLGQDGLGRAAR